MQFRPSGAIIAAVYQKFHDAMREQKPMDFEARVACEQ